MRRFAISLAIVTLSGALLPHMPQQSIASAVGREIPLIHGHSRPRALAQDAGMHHYEYVFPEGSIDVYDMDDNQKLVQHLPVPTSGVRGVSASATTGKLYISYGGDGDGNGNGGLLEYDLLKGTVDWTHKLSTGIDSMDVSPDGKRIYMPTGELSGGDAWDVLNAANGDVIATIHAGTGPHNTVMSLSGHHVYMGPRNSNYLAEADTSSNSVIQRIGPLYSGVRPFTITHDERYAFTTATGFLGFEVSDIKTGHVLYHVPIRGFSVPASYQLSAPSHGVSLSPDERELYVMDAANGYVHVFDVSELASVQPRQVADIKLRGDMRGPESPCAYDCAKDGWLQHSRDGRFVYVGDAGDVIDTATRTTVAVLPALANTRKFLEIDWAGGRPIFATPREGLGYGGVPSILPSTVTPSASPTPSLTPVGMPSIQPALAFTHVKIQHRVVRAGQKNRVDVWINRLQSLSVEMLLTLPDGRHRVYNGRTNAKGRWSRTFRVQVRVLPHLQSTATVRVAVSDHAIRIRRTLHFLIMRA